MMGLCYLPLWYLAIKTDRFGAISQDFEICVREISAVTPMQCRGMEFVFVPTAIKKWHLKNSAATDSLDDPQNTLSIVIISTMSLVETISSDNSWHWSLWIIQSNKDIFLLNFFNDDHKLNSMAWRQMCQTWMAQSLRFKRKYVVWMNWSFSSERKMGIK